MIRPHIAVTTSARSGWRIFPLIAFNLWLAGGSAVRWGVGKPSDLDDVDGLIIGGGDDIGPELYGVQIVTTARVDHQRDTLERELIEAALDRDMPVMGICRGAQMLNVALGGTLNRHAYSTYWGGKNLRTILPRKTVEIAQTTRLAQLAGETPMSVNALHSQAIDELGDGLSVCARDEAGMIQAIERVNDPFALGVQWHPEHLFYARRQRGLFAGLVAASRAARSGRSQLAAVDAHPT